MAKVAEKSKGSNQRIATSFQDMTNIPCGKCGKDLSKHPKELINGEVIIRKFGADCPY